MALVSPEASVVASSSAAWTLGDLNIHQTPITAPARARKMMIMMMAIFAFGFMVGVVGEERSRPEKEQKEEYA